MPFIGERRNVTAVAAVLVDGIAGDSFLLRNKSATDSVDLGGSGVASGQGFELAAGESLEVAIPGSDQLYAVAAAGKTVPVHVLRR